MDIEPGSRIEFKSPMGDAVLEGRVLLYEPAKDMFPEMSNDPRFGYTDETMFVSIRVHSVLQTDNESYLKPSLCKVPERKVLTILD